jgi:predicted phosphodiesterase
MASKYVEVYKEIYNGSGAISDRVRMAMEQYSVSLSFKSFFRMYQTWRSHNYGAEKHVSFGAAKLQDHVPDVGKTMQPTGQLDKLKHSLSEFNDILSELKPEAHNPLDLPPSQESNYQPYKLPINHNNILLIGDIHVPYHNIPALTLALKYGLENEVNTILLNGDIIDFYAISRFEKDPRKRNFGHEVLMTRQFLTTLRQLFPNAAIYYKCGNHDVRYDHYIMRNAPDLLGMNEFSFESLMKLDELNITFIPDKQIIRAGNLTILHGHELGTSVFSPVNIARGLFLRAKDNALCGHHHQASEHSEPNINGKLTTCWSVACLCELHPDYMPINKHHHGFAHVKVMDTGEFEVSNYRIVNGKIR